MLSSLSHLRNQVFLIFMTIHLAAAMSTSTTTSTTKAKKPLILFCHGSGDTGYGAQSWIESLLPKSVYEQYDWLYPSAKPIPYTLNGGMVTSVWYDRDAHGFHPKYPEQTQTVEESTQLLLDIIHTEIEDKGRTPNSILLGGFSMGGAIAYQTGIRYHYNLWKESLQQIQQEKEGQEGNEKCQSNTYNYEDKRLGGIFGLSCYLNYDSKVWSLLDEMTTKQSKDSSMSTLSSSSVSFPPMYMAHGTIDDFILPTWGQTTYETFQEKLHDLHAAYTHEDEHGDNSTTDSNMKILLELLPNLHHEMNTYELVQVLNYFSSVQ